jgi:purine-binding chemotaxis protein CheW
MLEELIQSTSKIVIFVLDNQRFALHLPVVERVTRAVFVTALPGAPEIVMGAINVHGQVIPVVDVRQRLGLPQRALEISDYFIVAHTTSRTVALAVDEIIGVLEVAQQDVVPTSEIIRDLPHLEGAIRITNDLILIYDLTEFLSLEEEAVLQKAMATDDQGRLSNS